MEVIKKYFPKLSEKQLVQFEQLGMLYPDWNDKINVISRKDIENLYVRHILHSLSIAKYITFQPGTSVMDLGTGGGFPAVPLAIMFPEVSFHAIDGTAKKIRVVQEISNEIGLTNIRASQLRAEENKEKYDFVVTRAVAAMEKLIPWSERLIHKTHKNATPNGMIALKGTNVHEELRGVKKYLEKVTLSQYFEEPFFEEKTLVYIQL